jgi:hypothetical protein
MHLYISARYIILIAEKKKVNDARPKQHFRHQHDGLEKDAINEHAQQGAQNPGG